MDREYYLYIKRVFNDPFFNQMINEYKLELNKRLLGTKRDESQERDDLYLQIQMMDDFNTNLKNKVSKGKKEYPDL